MAPSAIPVDSHHNLEHKDSASQRRKPLKSTGSLDVFTSDDITPVIGTEYPEANIVNDLLNSPDADQLLRDLAIKISERGVVFFRAQDNLTNDLQKQLIQRLGELSGKPSTSTLHIHPVLNDSRELGGSDPEISTISSVQRKQLYSKTDYRRAGAIWHSDISFEPAPADYTSLRLVKLPKTGGDTLWASGYEIYDRISEPYQKFLEGLTAAHIGNGFHEIAKTGKFELYEKARGSPDNVGASLEAHHPVVRTNPVTGWNSIFPVGTFPKYIDGLEKEESDNLLKWFHDLIINGHDLQVRFRWRNPNDIAIWDNRSVFHTATNDYDGLGDRFGNRAVGIGERPYFDPSGTSRRQALAAAAEAAQ